MLTDFVYGLLDVIFLAVVKFRCMKIGFDKILIFLFFFVLKFATNFTTDYICDRKHMAMRITYLQAKNWSQKSKFETGFLVANLRPKKRSQILNLSTEKLVSKFKICDRFFGHKFVTNSKFRNQKIGHKKVNV